MKRALVLSVIAALFCLAPAGRALSQTGGSYVIGLTAAQSGPLATIGKGLTDGVTAYFKRVNAQGGVNGHQIEFFPLDDQTNGTAAVANLKELVQVRHASVVLGWSLSNTVAAALPVAQQTKIAILGQAMTPESLDPSAGVGFGGDVLIPSMAAPEIGFAAQRLVKAGAAPKVAIIDMDSAAQRELQSKFLGLAKAKGWNVTSTQLVPLTTSDMTNYVVAFKNANPDFVVGSLDSTRMVLCVRAMHGLNVTIPFVNYSGASDLGPLEAMKEPSMYAMSAFAFASDPTPVMQRYVEDMKAIGANPAEPLAIHGYTQAFVTVNVLKKCGYPCSAEAFLKALQSYGTMNTDGLTVAPLEYSKSYHGGFRSVRYFHWDPARGRPTPISGLIRVD